MADAEEKEDQDISAEGGGNKCNPTLWKHLSSRSSTSRIYLYTFYTNIHIFMYLQYVFMLRLLMIVNLVEIENVDTIDTDKP